MQYTERFRLQLVNGQVQVAALGCLLTATRAYTPVAAFVSTAQRLYFAATRHSLSGSFLRYWRSHKGTTLLGAPIAEPSVEPTNDGHGGVYLVQWFENGRLEYHPESARTGQAVSIGQTGRQDLQRRSWLPPTTAALAS